MPKVYGYDKKSKVSGRKGGGKVKNRKSKKIWK